MTNQPQNSDSSFLDKFERARESMWGQPGFQRRNSTVISSGWVFLPQGTWIIETIKTNESLAIFLQVIDKDGGQRIVLPQKVCEAIYRQSISITRARRSVGAKQAMEKRMADPNYEPFGGKPFRKNKD